MGTGWSQGALPIGARFAKFAFGLDLQNVRVRSPLGQVLGRDNTTENRRSDVTPADIGA